MPAPKPTKTGNGWFPISKTDLRTIYNRIPGHRAISALAVWVQLLQLANMSRSVKVAVFQQALAKYAHLSLRMVAYCIVDLRDAGLLDYTAPRLTNGRQGQTVFTIKPSIAPFGGKPDANSAHGFSGGAIEKNPVNIDSAPCAKKDAHRLHSIKQGDNQRLSPIDKNDAPDPAHAPDGAGRPASGKKPKRRTSWMPEGRLS